MKEFRFRWESDPFASAAASALACANNEDLEVHVGGRNIIIPKKPGSEGAFAGVGTSWGSRKGSDVDEEEDELRHFIKELQAVPDLCISTFPGPKFVTPESPSTVRQSSVSDILSLVVPWERVDKLQLGKQDHSLFIVKQRS